ncbi:hypothetical protein QR680_015128 [Steinernema hermaphroditum]|uniref:Uncharacterized protein n=1 Tax=Steinernema hermaphroditum TaxID=289476 RepID=A0AA39M5F9_9BILA|nr:hypothetical protein QR680_015128 [Steinernema hermaphroditum]
MACSSFLSCGSYLSLTSYIFGVVIDGFCTTIRFKNLQRVANPAFLVGEPYHGAGTVAAGNLPYPPPPRTNNFMRTDPDRFKKANVKLDQLEAAMGQVEPLGLGIDEDVMLSEEPLKESTW